MRWEASQREVPLARALLPLTAMNRMQDDTDSEPTLYTPPDEPAAPAAPAELPLDWERTVYNMLFRAIGNRKLAKQLLRQLQAAGIQAEVPVTRQARDLARTELSPDEYARTMFARGRELLSGGPDTEDLPRLGAGFDPVGMEKEVKDVLPREHLGLLELVFVDRRPLAEVADLFGVSPEFVVTFIAHLVDLVGDLSAMVHGAASPCPHPLRLIRSQIEHTLGYNDRQPATNPDCSACSDAGQFTHSLLELFSRDSRILSLGDDRVFKKALEGPRVQVNDGQNRAFPVRNDKPADPLADIAGPRALPEPNTAAWKATALVGCCLIFMISFSAFSILSGPGDGEGPGFKKGLATVKRDVLGTFADANNATKDLIANSTLTAGAEKPMILNYHSGIQVEVPPGGSVTVLPNRVKLLKGRIRMRTTEGPSSGFFLAVGDLVARIKEGDVWANLSDSSPIRFSLRTGVLDVKDSRGRRYRLEASNVMKVAANGTSFVVEEATAEDIAAMGGDNKGTAVQ
jgi:hypothetical protein